MGRGCTRSKRTCSSGLTLWNGENLDFILSAVGLTPSDGKESEAQFLDREDLLEKAMATHSSILDWRILQRIQAALFHGVAKSWP